MLGLKIRLKPKTELQKFGFGFAFSILLAILRCYNATKNMIFSKIIVTLRAEKKL